MKYGIVGLQIPFLELELPLTLACGIELRDHVKIESEFWIDGLGKWKIEELERSNLVVVASMESERPEVLDKEHSDLVERAWRFVTALMLTGAKFNRAPVILKSSLVEDGENLRHYSEARPWMETKDQAYTMIDRARIAEAEAVIVGIDRVLAKDFRRFRKGLFSISSGLSERSCDDRAYFFARALEATQATIKGEGKSAYVVKCQGFAGKSPARAELFDDLYEIRSNVAHVKAFSDLVKPGETDKEAEDRIVSRCSDAEIICKEVYRRILSDPALLDHFVDDPATRAYWDSNPLWDPPVDVGAIRAQRHAELDALHHSP